MSVDFPSWYANAKGELEQLWLKRPNMERQLDDREKRIAVLERTVNFLRSAGGRRVGDGRGPGKRWNDRFYPRDSEEIAGTSDCFGDPRQFGEAGFRYEIVFESPGDGPTVLRRLAEAEEVETTHEMAPGKRYAMPDEFQRRQSASGGIRAGSGKNRRQRIRTGQVERLHRRGAAAAQRQSRPVKGEALMGVGIRTKDLRKVYTSPPPLAGAGAAIRGDARRRKSKRGRTPQVIALDGVSLDVQAGEIFGLLGPNGAGKSTTVGIITTRVRPTSGEAWIGAARRVERSGERQTAAGSGAAAAQSRFFADRARDSSVPRRVFRGRTRRSGSGARMNCSNSFSSPTAPTS